MALQYIYIEREKEMSCSDNSGHGCCLIVHSQLLTTHDLHHFVERAREQRETRRGRQGERGRRRIDWESQSSDSSDHRGLDPFPRKALMPHGDPK